MVVGHTYKGSWDLVTKVVNKVTKRIAVYIPIIRNYNLTY